MVVAATEERLSCRGLVGATRVSVPVLVRWQAGHWMRKDVDPSMGPYRPAAGRPKPGQA